MKYKINIFMILCLLCSVVFTACGCQSKDERDLEKLEEAEKQVERFENNYEDSKRELEQAEKDFAEHDKLKKRVESAE